MTNAIFKKAVFVSILGHAAVFSIFSFTFGSRVASMSSIDVSFLGGILSKAEFNSRPFIAPAPATRDFVIKERPDIAVLDKAKQGYDLSLRPYHKPPASVFFSREKLTFLPERQPLSLVEKRKDPLIMLYPPLPYHFLLYFKDRQRVHIEVMFKIITGPQANIISVKRKISSGNLEVDLLSGRYLSHYLFIQQARFTPNSWQVVKIDLSAKND